MDQVLNNLVTQAIRGRIGMMEANLERFNHLPAWWAEDVTDSISYLQACLYADKFWIPGDFRESEDVLFDYFLKFADLLTHWREIYHNASLYSSGFLGNYRC